MRLYCFDPRHYGGTHYFNFPKTGPHRLKFLLESVQDLRNTLKERGSNLLLRRGKPEEIIAGLVKQLGNVSAVTLHEENLVASYKDTRNGLIGIDYSTKFAPWLALGCISPRYIYEQIRKYEKERTANQSTYWVIFELLWRDYFRFVALKYGRRIFFLRGLQDKDVPWKKDPKLFDAWKEGRTGVPFVDANMRELAMTGFMSNRGRQNVDYDVCSNYGNWLYSAGIGNDPRENRKFNMIKQGLDYDAGGDYIRLWVPELQQIKGGDAHTPWALSTASLAHSNVSLGETYPYPIVMAPEWSRHINQKPSGSWETSARRGKGPSHTPKQHRNRGIDFYFSRNKNV
uniref:Photolyase/cryptochrome alpha/beta domain-containing protein n=1 Tax=Xenopus tropicalis TaxID=8364 RepID=A0A1B8YA04_XENTR